MDQRKYGYMLVMPAIAILLALNLFPLIYDIFLSLVNWQIRFAGSQPTFAGASNFATVVTDPRFYNDVGVTLALIAVVVPVENFLGLGLAMLLSRKIRGSRVIGSIIIMPLALSSAVAGMIWSILLFCSFGPVDSILELLGIWRTCANPLWNYPIQSIMVADIWQWTPFFFLIFLAGLSSLPREPLEAAQVDGASAYQTFRHVTLPMLAPVMGVGVILRMMDVFQTFGVPYILTGGGPGVTSETIALYIYRAGLGFFNLTYAAALALVLLVVVSVLITLFVRIYPGGLAR